MAVNRYYGGHDAAAVKHILALTYSTAIVVTLLCMGGLYFMRNSVGIVFGASKAASSEVAVYLPPFLTALLFLSYVRITTAYFYATEKTKLSYMLVYAELVLSVLLMITLPLVLDLHGVWLAIPVAQGFTGCIAAAAKYRENH